MHRVIARFAREGLWKQIWSLNWDCMQESALEAIGIRRGDEPEPDRLPWPTLFHTFVTNAECASLATSNSIHVVKPHGCIRSLIEADDAQRNGDHRRSEELAARFLITKTELAALAPAPGTQNFIFSHLCTGLSAHPLIIAGWRISESYLIDYIEEHVKPNLEARSPLPHDELTIVDISFNENGHTRLAACYGKTSAQVHAQVQPNDFTADDLFLWIQTLYGLQWLENVASSSDKATLKAMRDELTRDPAHPSSVTEWMDDFLTTWVRLCWRCDLINAHYNSRPIPPHHIALNRDEHVPWSYGQADRTDLRAAARILATLQRKGSIDKWDARQYPGGFFRDGALVVPVPAWMAVPPNSLDGLKALIDAIQERGSGFVESIRMLPVLHNPSMVVAEDTIRALIETLRRQLTRLPAAVTQDIVAVDLEDL